MRAVVSVTLIRLEGVDVCVWVVDMIKCSDTLVFLVQNFMVNVVENQSAVQTVDFHKL